MRDLIHDFKKAIVSRIPNVVQQIGTLEHIISSRVLLTKQAK